MSLQQSLFFPQPEQLQQDADFLSLRINRIIALNKYKATKELGKLTYLLNEHSGFYKYRLYWNK